MRAAACIMAGAILSALALWPAASLAMDPDKAPEKAVEEVSTDAGALREMVQESYDLAERWFLNSLQKDHTFVYLYDPVRREYPDANNAIRQLMATRLLGELAGENPRLLKLHAGNMRHVFFNWYREKGKIGYIYLNGKASLGASGVALRAIAWSPYAERYERRAQRIVDGIRSVMNPNGSFRAFLVEPPEDEMKDEDFLLSYYSGEAILGLLEYAQRFGDDSALRTAQKAQEFYLDHYVTHLEDNYRPFYVPWHTMSMTALHKITGDPRFVDAIFRLNDELLKIQDLEKYPGRFASLEKGEYSKGHSASDGVYTESLAYALAMARKVKDSGREARYLKALDLAVRNLVTLQFTTKHSPLFVGDPRVPGGIRVRAKTFKIRIDCVQHAMDAHRKLLTLL